MRFMSSISSAKIVITEAWCFRLVSKFAYAPGEMLVRSQHIPEVYECPNDEDVHLHGSVAAQD
jgi:hypothetical protein